ncbi:MAG: ATP-binding cassette domain-containing protein [Desulfovibrionaceae bacterium]
MPCSPLFSVRNVCKSYKHNAAFMLQIPHLDIMAGEKVAFIGPSGCGKSTALDILAGILRPDTGERFVFSLAGEERDILALWAAGKRNILSALRLHHVGYVLQTGGLLPFLSVRENIVLTRRALGLGADPLVEELVHVLELAPLQHALPSRLSVGERQRVAIARALASRPTLVLADEPTAALDPPKARVVMELFTQLTTQLGCTVVMVTHAPDMAVSHGFQLLPLRVSCHEGITSSRLEGRGA